MRMGGVVTPDAPLPHAVFRGKEECYEQQSERAEEAGPTTRPRTGWGASTAGQAAAAHAVRRGLGSTLELDEVYSHFPGTTWLTTSSGSAILSVPVRPFVSGGYTSRLFLEIPPEWPLWADARRDPGWRYAVPDIRAWASWDTGIAVRSHHEYPDRSICSHRPSEWQLGRDPLIHLVCYSVLWIAKVLHLQVLGRWPGRQHYPMHMRVRRDAVDEYCGCGAERTYRECCREADQAMSAAERMMQLYDAERAYLREARYRGLVISPDWAALSPSSS